MLKMMHSLSLCTESTLRQSITKIPDRNYLLTSIQHTVRLPHDAAAGWPSTGNAMSAFTHLRSFAAGQCGRARGRDVSDH